MFSYKSFIVSVSLPVIISETVPLTVPRICQMFERSRYPEFTSVGDILIDYHACASTRHDQSAYRILHTKVEVSIVHLFQRYDGSARLTVLIYSLPVYKS